MSKVIAVANQKGGCGKTATTSNLAGVYSEDGLRVLAVDLDPQGGLTTSFGINLGANQPSVYQSLKPKHATPLAGVIVPTKFKGVHLAPAKIDLADAEVDLLVSKNVSWGYALKNALAPVLPKYDVVLIDCPPSLGALTMIALAACDLCVIPLQAEFLALRATRELQDRIREIRAVNPTIKERVLVTMSGRSIHAREVAEEIKAAFQDRVSDIIIKRSIRFADSTIAGKPLVLYDPRSDAAEAYRQFAKEVMHYV